MKTRTDITIRDLNEKEAKGSTETSAIAPTQKSECTRAFNILDLWRIQKKHKTLGSSIRW